MKIRYQFGRALGWPLRTLLRARWFPLLRTFHLRQNWAYDVCRFAGTRDIRMVFDVGANVGDLTAYAADFFAGATIHAFEPVSATCAILRQRTHVESRVQVHQLALGRHTEEVEIALQPASVFNGLGFRADPKGPPQRTERIRVTTVDEFCAGHGITHIDVLKSDAQGFDVDVLQGASNLIARSGVCFVYTEVGFIENDTYNTPFASADQHLRAKGFELAGFYEPAGLGPRGRVLGFCNALYLHGPALEQRFGKTT
jgi:FkbM family methyltransferase